MSETTPQGSTPVASESKATTAADPSARLTKAQEITRRHVLWALGAGVVPFPIVDVVAVMAVHVKMLKEFSDLYGVEITTVREIRAWNGATPLPNTRDFVRGVINLRGSIVPVVDLRRRWPLWTAHTVVTALAIANFYGKYYMEIEEMTKPFSEDARTKNKFRKDKAEKIDRLYEIPYSDLTEFYSKQYIGRCPIALEMWTKQRRPFFVVFNIHQLADAWNLDRKSVV